MPEGPEVRRTVDNLKQYEDYIIKKITINSGRYTKKDFKKQKLLFEDLPLKIIDVKCKGKFIYFKLSNNMYLFNTLGVADIGQLIILNIIMFLLFKKNNKKLILHFNDVRNFGTLMYQNEKDLDAKLKCLGVDIMKTIIILMNLKRIERKEIMVL